MRVNRTDCPFEIPCSCNEANRVAGPLMDLDQLLAEALNAFCRGSSDIPWSRIEGILYSLPLGTEDFIALERLLSNTLQALETKQFGEARYELRQLSRRVTRILQEAQRTPAGPKPRRNRRRLKRGLLR